jgi:hypothetical protein
VELIGRGKDFLTITQKAQQLRERIDKWDSMKLKSFCTTTEMVTKRRAKIFTSYISDKRLITRIYRKLKKLNFQKNQ